MKSEYLHERESEFVIGRIFEVRNRLGGGWGEEVYHQALVRHLTNNDVPTVSKPREVLLHRNNEIQTFIPDIIVWDKIILELKVLPDFKRNQFPSAHQGQLIHYLKKFKKNLGLLVNFAHSKVGIKRMILEKTSSDIVENYDRIKIYLQHEDREILIKIRKAILRIAHGIGIGYKEDIYRKIIGLELEAVGISCVSEVVIPATWEDEVIYNQSTHHLLVAGRFLLLIRANLERPTTFDYIKTRSYLTALGLKSGLIVNFGRNTVQIFGTTP